MYKPIQVRERTQHLFKVLAAQKEMTFDQLIRYFLASEGHDCKAGPEKGCEVCSVIERP